MPLRFSQFVVAAGHVTPAGCRAGFSFSSSSPAFQPVGKPVGPTPELTWMGVRWH